MTVTYRTALLGLIVSACAGPGTRVPRASPHADVRWSPGLTELSEWQRGQIEGAIEPLGDSVLAVASLADTAAQVWIVRVLTGRGTSWRQEAFAVVRPGRIGRLVIAWAALALDRAVYDEFLPVGPYTFVGCVESGPMGYLQYRRGAIGDHSAINRILTADTLARQPGHYQWSSRTGEYLLVYPDSGLGDHVLPRCR